MIGLGAILLRASLGGGVWGGDDVGDSAPDGPKRVCTHTRRVHHAIPALAATMTGLGVQPSRRGPPSSELPPPPLAFADFLRGLDMPIIITSLLV